MYSVLGVVNCKPLDPKASRHFSNLTLTPMSSFI